jgi:EpsG-like putative glucosyltransferase
MIGYLLFFVPLSVLAFFESTKFKEEYINYLLKLVWPFVIILAYVFIGLRYKVGADWFQYYDFLNTVEKIDAVLSGANKAPIFTDAPFEIGFKILCVLIKSLGGGFQVLLAIITAYNLFALTWFVKRYIPDHRYMFMLLLYAINIFREFDILRQSVAFYTMLFAIPCINKSFFKYLLICIAAALFHYSALIFVPVYGFFKLQFSRKLILVALCLYILNFIIPFRVLTTMGKLFMLIPSSFGLLLSKFLAYIELFPNPVKFNFLAVVNIFILISFLFFYDKLITKENKSKSLLVAFITYIFLCVIFSEVDEIYGRFAYYFSLESAFVLAIMSPYYFSYKRIIYNISLLGIALIKFMSPLKNEAAYLTYFPYNNYLFISGNDDKIIMNRFYKAKEKTEEYYEDQN